MTGRKSSAHNLKIFHLISLIVFVSSYHFLTALYCWGNRLSPLSDRLLAWWPLPSTSISLSPLSPNREAKCFLLTRPARGFVLNLMVLQRYGDPNRESGAKLLTDWKRQWRRRRRRVGWRCCIRLAGSLLLCWTWQGDHCVTPHCALTELRHYAK